MSQPLYKATYLYNGVHYEGNTRFEYGQPVIVDEETARSLQATVVVHTSYDAAGVGQPDPKPKFRLEAYTPPAEAPIGERPVVLSDEAQVPPAVLTTAAVPVVPPARTRTAPAPQ